MLENKTALVTGAGRGIGRAIALALAEYGADVAVNYSGSREQAEETVRRITEMGRKAVAIQADVSKEEDCVRMFAQAEEALGPVDILVNNAGITRDGLAVRMSGEDFEKVLDVNLKGAFYCMKLAAKGMMKRRYGRIVSISSISGVKGNAGQINYCAAKAGIIGMTKSLARELAPRGITVNAIAPGYIESDMTAVLPDKVKESVLSQVPLGRMGKPEEIAQAAAFLASDRAAYITGQTLLVDGGMGI
ncbi:MAG TPA: 3-oxoacyl-[acyl-carrier-protein] reductase [Candidatus Choladousia intestinavium]|uniref:3-oxoacyl-[acyl-carrier-protein] reductase n=1 Tax=Candidatus Choladousia intestinavium TaxID=2840727 RepID=A0A9D1ADD8_9FIRM|nr:3-oxoacyl-[acyl-carrier-protein] reductase [Candidatus Choladousia intestinavium]